jgi:CubicO group peptidase (beta-lactamase class C family)
MRFRPFISLVVVALPSLVPIARADELDDYITLQMQRRHIPGLSLCIFDDGKVVRARGYGVLEKGHATPVTADTLFMAGSISKPVTALAALVLVDEGRLSLDEDVNAKLVTWKVPTNAFTEQSKVTLRNLLSHSSGMAGPFFEGYRFDSLH